MRGHLEGIPNAVDLKNWKLQIEGNVHKPVVLSLPELMQKFKAVSLAAVNQCSGNSRSRLQPRVPGGQWGNGAMGNAMWTGVRLRELLDMAGVKSGSLMVQFQGDCARTVHESNVFIALGLASSEQQIPQIVENIGNQNSGRSRWRELRFFASRGSPVRSR